MGQQLLGRFFPGRLNMEAMYPCPDPVHLYSPWRGQDHSVRFLPAKLQNLVVLSLNTDFVTWLKAMGVREGSRFINLANGRPELLLSPMEGFQRFQNCTEHIQIEYLIGDQGTWEGPPI